MHLINKQTMKKILTLLFLACMSLGLYAEKQVSGVVVDAKGEPVIGASIQAKGTTLGTISDYDGRFEMDVPESVKTLVVSFVGMATQEVAAGKKCPSNPVGEQRGDPGGCRNRLR